jgi:hypothetical protein
MSKKWASVQKIKLPHFSLCRNRQNHVAGPPIGPHGRAQGRNEFRRKKLPADLAPSDGGGHVFARSRLDTLLSVCVVRSSRRPLSISTIILGPGRCSEVGYKLADLANILPASASLCWEASMHPHNSVPSIQDVVLATHNDSLLLCRALIRFLDHSSLPPQ